MEVLFLVVYFGWECVVKVEWNRSRHHTRMSWFAAVCSYEAETLFVAAFGPTVTTELKAVNDLGCSRDWRRLRYLYGLSRGYPGFSPMRIPHTVVEGELCLLDYSTAGFCL